MEADGAGARAVISYLDCRIMSATRPVGRLTPEVGDPTRVHERRRTSMASSASPRPASEHEPGASPAEKKVAIVTGASQGIGAGVAAAFAVGTARSVESSATPDVLMVPGD